MIAGRKLYKIILTIKVTKTSCVIILFIVKYIILYHLLVVDTIAVIC